MNFPNHSQAKESETDRLMCMNETLPIESTEAL